jgi:hypothetical protein
MVGQVTMKEVDHDDNACLVTGEVHYWAFTGQLAGHFTGYLTGPEFEPLRTIDEIQRWFIPTHIVARSFSAAEALLFFPVPPESCEKLAEKINEAEETPGK